jgi:hypothetical protein
VKKSAKIIALIVALIVGWSAADICLAALSLQTAKDKKEKKETFTRPAPTKPLRPEIPGANRYQSGKVFLERADSLYTTPLEGRDLQILKGNVEFRQGGMFMYCDSAYYYPENNSMDAFGNVRMVQGDTLKGYADVVYYDGDTRRARMRTRGLQKVRLENRNVTLTTDSLDYDLVMEYGDYFNGGRIDDKVNDLTSINGRYSPRTKLAEFDNDVKLVNKKDGYTLLTDQLLYNTTTKIATIDRPAIIMGKTDTIRTNKGEYDTARDHAILQSRSLITHRDTANNVVTLEGDSIIYDKISRVSEAFTFSDPVKARPMVLTDTAHHAVLIGGYGYYNDSTRTALATKYPLLKEYSRPDTIFMRADTISTQVMTMMVPVITPIRQDTIFQNSIALDSIGIDAIIPKSLPDSLTGSLPDSTGMRIIAVNDTAMTPKDYYLANAIRNARFFRTDLQGVADTMRYNQADSMLYMYRRPVVWNEDKQVAGNTINVHFNDSTVDWALLPEFGILSQQIEGEYYNQLAGKKMLANFKESQLTHLYVEGNVQAIFLPMENDSTYNKIVAAEGSYLTIDMKENSAQTDTINAKNSLEKLKMWPDVTGKVTPIFLIKKNQLYLPIFKEIKDITIAIRPKREWYDDGKLRWADDLGDVPDELEQYLSMPPMSGKQKAED